MTNFVLSNSSKVSVEQLFPFDMPALIEVREYVMGKMASGEAKEHKVIAPYSGKPVTDLSVRNSYKIRTDVRVELTEKMDALAKRYLENNFSLPPEGYSFVVTQSEYFYYPKGVGVGMHTDDHVLTTTGAKVVTNKYRAVTALLYLNESFEGGELVFPREQDGILTVAPKAGLLVMFPATHRFPHLVKPITSGFRVVLQRMYGVALKNELYTDTYNESCC